MFVGIFHHGIHHWFFQKVIILWEYSHLVGGFKYFHFHPSLGKIHILTNICSKGLVQPPTSNSLLINHLFPAHPSLGVKKKKQPQGDSCSTHFFRFRCGNSSSFPVPPWLQGGGLYFPLFYCDCSHRKKYMYKVGQEFQGHLKTGLEPGDVLIFFGLNPPKQGLWRTKTRVVWVPGGL